MLQLPQFTYVNKGALLNLGYSDEIQALTPLDLKQSHNKLLWKLINPLLTEKKIIFFTIHQRKDGTSYQ
jgi:hypothetical protein